MWSLPTRVFGATLNQAECYISGERNSAPINLNPPDLISDRQTLSFALA